MDSIRQLQIAELIKQSVSDIFIREGRNYYGNAFVTITHVKVTPDLLLARIYLSVYNVANKQEVPVLVREHSGNIRHLLGNKIRHKVRRIPELEFYLDETLDEAFRIESLLDRLRKEGEIKDDDDGNA